MEFRYGFHFAADILVSIDQLASRIKHEGMRAVFEAFAINVNRVADSGLTPVKLVFWSRSLQQWIDEACVEVWGSLNATDVADLPNQQYEDAVQRNRDKSLSEWEANPDEHANRLLLSAGQLEVFLQKDEDIRRGLDAVL